METLPTILLSLSLLLFLAGGILSVRRLVLGREGLRLYAEVCRWAGVVVGVGGVMVYSAWRGVYWPLTDNFDALGWLGLLLVCFAGYLKQRGAPRGVDWFVMPAAIGLISAALVVGVAGPRSYHVESLWHWTHRVGSYAGAAAFALAGAGGLAYLLSVSRLRAKSPPGGGDFNSLERLERFTYASTLFGFALLTVGMITGVVRAAGPAGSALGPAWFASPKVLLAAGVWAVYALVMHAPINPRFRGRRAAVLSIAGFVLMIAAVLAAQLAPVGN